MRNFIFACALMLSFSVFVGCDKDDDDEPGNGGGGSVNVSSGTVQMGDDSFKAKYVYIVYGSYFDEDENEYIFSDKDVLKYAENGMDMDDVNEEFSMVYMWYDPDYKYIDEIEIDFKVNAYQGTGFYILYEGSHDIDNYVDFSASKNSVKASAKSIPMVRCNVRTGNETNIKVSFSLEGTPIDVSDYVDYDDDDYTRGAIEVKEVSDPKQVAFLRSFRHKKAN